MFGLSEPQLHSPPRAGSFSEKKEPSPEPKYSRGARGTGAADETVLYSFRRVQMTPPSRSCHAQVTAFLCAEFDASAKSCRSNRNTTSIHANTLALVSLLTSAGGPRFPEDAILWFETFSEGRNLPDSPKCGSAPRAGAGRSWAISSSALPER